MSERRLYVDISASIKRQMLVAQASRQSNEYFEGMEKVVQALADVFAVRAPRSFDRRLFLNNCGIRGDKSG